MAPHQKGNPPKVKKVKSSAPQLPVLHLHAAGIDIGAREIYVAVPPGTCERTVRSFPTFTGDLHALQRLIAECDEQIATLLQGFDSKSDAKAAPLAPAKNGGKKARRNQPQFAAREECYRVLGVDLTVVPGLAAPTVLVLLCELGPEFAQKFPTAKHFGSWLGLCPDNRITGGKIYSVKTGSVGARSFTHAFLTSSRTQICLGRPCF